MSSSIQKITLIGASGNLGPHILHALQAAGLTTTILTRPTSSSTFDAGIKVLKASYSDLPALKDAFAGQDAVVCAVGFAGYLDQLTLIDAAEAVGVKRFILSEFGNHPDQPCLPELKQMLEPKTRVLEHAKAKAEKNPRFSWSAVACGLFFDWSLVALPMMGFVVPTRVATIYDAGTEPISVTSIAKVGQAVANILLHPSETANHFLKIRSLLITQRDVLAAFEEITGQAWEVKNVETKDTLAQAKEKLAKGDFIEAFLRLLTVQLFEGGAGRSVVTSVEESDNELLGVTKDDLGEVLRGALSTVGTKA